MGISDAIVRLVVLGLSPRAMQFPTGVCRLVPLLIAHPNEEQGEKAE